MRIQLRVSELPQEPPIVVPVDGGVSVEVRFGDALSITLPQAVAETLGSQLMGAGIINQEFPEAGDDR